jgi:hypothetical protein
VRFCWERSEVFVAQTAFSQEPQNSRQEIQDNTGEGNLSGVWLLRLRDTQSGYLTAERSAR